MSNLIKNHGHLFSLEDDKNLSTLITEIVRKNQRRSTTEEKIDIQQIAKDFGRTYYSISNRLRHLRSLKKIPDDYLNYVLSKNNNVKRKPIKKFKMRDSTFTQPEKEYVVLLRENGKSYDAIKHALYEKFNISRCRETIRTLCMNQCIVPTIKIKRVKKTSMNTEQQPNSDTTNDNTESLLDTFLKEIKYCIEMGNEIKQLFSQM